MIPQRPHHRSIVRSGEEWDGTGGLDFESEGDDVYYEGSRGDLKNMIFNNIFMIELITANNT